MQNTAIPNDAWKQIAPTLDEGLEQLGETDRNALLLRFVEGKNHNQVGAVLGLSEEAARKRVDRAIEKLRSFFTGRGFTLSATVLTSALLANVAKAAPPVLMNSVTTIAVKCGIANTMALPVLARQTLDAWRWANIKLTAALAASTAIMVALVMILPSRHASRPASTPSPKEVFATAVNKDNAANQTNPSPPLASPVVAVVTNVLHFHVVAQDNGEPVANAKLAVNTVTPNKWDTRYDLVTDQSGICDVPLPPGLGRLDVGVLSSGWGARFYTWRIDQGTLPPQDYTLRVERLKNSVGGWLQDETGNPVANARISIEFGGTGDASWRETPKERSGFMFESPVATTDDEGRWICSVIPSDNRGFTLTAKHPDFAPTQIESSDPNQNQPDSNRETLQQLWAGTLLTTMRHGLTLVGRVTDAADQPVVGARIEHNPASTQPLALQTDANGRFAVPKLTAGEFEFMVSAAGFAPEFRKVNLKEGMDPLEIKLQPGALLLLRVVDDQGLAVPDATIGLQALGEHHNVLQWSARSDSNGRIKWDSAPARDTLELYAHKDGWCYTRQIDVMADGQEHTINLQRVLKLSGNVVDAKTGAAVPTFSVFPGYGEGSGESVWFRGETQHGTNGAFTLEFKENRQPWRVQVEAEGYQPMISDPIPPYYTGTMGVSLQAANPAKAIRGLVLSPDGTPADGAQVAILSLDYSASLGQAKFRDNGTGILTNTDASGWFNFPPNPREHSVAAVNAAGFAKLRVQDPREPVTLQLQPWGRIEGTVAEKERSLPIESIVLMDDTAMNYHGALSLDINNFSAKPDSSGRFSFENVPGGCFTLYICRGMGIPFSCQTEVVVRPGETTVANIGGKGYTVVGRLTARPGQVSDWVKQTTSAQLSADVTPLPSPPSNLTGDQAALWAVDFWQSEAGINYYRHNNSHSFGITVAADGAFRAEDVEPGTYKLLIVGDKVYLQKDVTVPEIPEGTTGAVDLGTFELPSK